MGFPGDQPPRRQPYRRAEPQPGPHRPEQSVWDRPGTAAGPASGGPSVWERPGVVGGPASGGPSVWDRPGAAAGPAPAGPASGGPSVWERSDAPAAGPRPAPASERSAPAPAEPAHPQARPSAPSRSRRPLFFAASAAAVVGAVALGVHLASTGEERQPVAADPSASSPAPAVTDNRPPRPEGRYGYATSRATDPQPLTLRELFSRRKVTVGKRTYLLAARRMDKTCKNAVEGERLIKALKSAGCTQLIRASFQDASGKIIGTVGVANLKTSAGAKKVAQAGTGKELKDYVKPLQGKKGATKFLGQGEALAGAWTHGHYAVLLWFQFKDGHRPDKTEHKRLDQAAADITDHTVFPALDTRALTGGRAG